MPLRTYEVHDNYDRPFKVVVEKTKVTVFDIRKDAEGTLVKTYKPIKIFVGHSTGRMSMSDHTPAQAREFEGNSILLQLSPRKFAYVGHEIYEFVTTDEPVAYFSLVGNNDVPYPVLLGTKEVYMMLDHKHVRREDFPEKFTDWEDAYATYYGHVGDKHGLEAIALPMRNFKLIQKRT
jgi:hypothetical protein